MKHSEKTEVGALTLNNMQGPIYLLALFLFLSTLILLAENIFRK
jgi:hypothetical protein